MKMKFTSIYTKQEYEWAPKVEIIYYMRSGELSVYKFEKPTFDRSIKIHTSAKKFHLH